jgi:oligoribonuclease NrnB/cAMP/cGMP phosphodiesterase (DHH superfamily)
MIHYNPDLLGTLENTSIHIYHSKDMDGLTCAVLGYLYDMAEYQFGYDYNDDFFQNESDLEKFNNCKIIFTDVVPTFDIIKKLDKNNEIIIVDHHISMYENWLACKDELKNTKVIYSSSICASRLLHDVLENNHTYITDSNYLSDYNKLIDIVSYTPLRTKIINNDVLGIFIREIVDSYDLYKFEQGILERIDKNILVTTEQYLPVIFNSIFTSMYSDKNHNFNNFVLWKDYVMALIKDQSCEHYTPVDFLMYHASKYKDGKILDIHNDRLNSRVKNNVYNFADTSLKVAFVMNSTPSFYSNIYLKQNVDADFVIYLSLTDKLDKFSVSLRTIKEDIDVREIAVKYFNGGGHIKASGGIIELPTLCKYLNL